MNAKNRGVGLIGLDLGPVPKKELTAGVLETLCWFLELVLEFAA
jgi:hypothetical protein